MEVGQVEIAVYATLGGCLMCIKHTDTEEAYKWLKSRPKLLTSLSMKGRLMNDIAGFEDDRGFIANAVNCYMKQYGVTKLEAIRDLQKEVANCDKIINEESLKNIDVPLQNRKLVFKILRMLNVSYNEGEGFTFTKGKFDKYIASLFVNRICRKLKYCFA
ncbi:hypothetical protein Bca4012_030231 [Brassica carinata]|uniref:BnaC04g54630D protein n=3 Tax=Brassica TaxID=3705 RepID=A0A078JCC6_BRANA|nr:BnaC04g54630D [Brassica napus]